MMGGQLVREGIKISFAQNLEINSTYKYYRRSPRGSPVLLCG